MFEVMFEVMFEAVCSKIPITKTGQGKLGLPCTNGEKLPSGRFVSLQTDQITTRLPY
jgi:hypothetical protein